MAEYMNVIEDSIIEEELAPVRHGRWLYDPKFGSTRPYHCSLPDCGASYPGRFLYCPNCGAKMDCDSDR